MACSGVVSFHGKKLSHHKNNLNTQTSTKNEQCRFKKQLWQRDEFLCEGEGGLSRLDAEDDSRSTAASHFSLSVQKEQDY
jgi:hypothetical protein